VVVNVYNILDIINFYKSFSKYKHYTDEEILLHILPSIKLNQYHIKVENSNIYSFVNWAYLSEAEEHHFIKTNTMKDSAWHSGGNVWVIDFIASKNVPDITKWLKEYFTTFLGFDKKVKWSRVYNGKIIHKTFYTKESFLNG
jgi:hemolysin-activating ACP:hemolysin acyltransferase